MRGVRVPDLNGSSEADTALDLTLSLSVGDSRGEKKVVPDQATPDTSTRIAKLKNPQLVRTPTYPSTGGKFNAMLGNGAPAFNLFHAKVKMEEAPDAGSSSGVLSEDSRIAQGILVSSLYTKFHLQNTYSILLYFYVAYFFLFSFLTHIGGLCK